jgi:hypothetical protein
MEEARDLAFIESFFFDRLSALYERHLRYNTEVLRIVGGLRIRGGSDRRKKAPLKKKLLDTHFPLSFYRS